MSLIALVLFPLRLGLFPKRATIPAPRSLPFVLPPRENAEAYAVSRERLALCESRGWPYQQTGGSCAGCGNPRSQELRLASDPSLPPGSCVPLCRTSAGAARNCRPVFRE